MLTQLTPPPNSQVAAIFRCGSHSVMVPPALPSTWNRPPSFRSPATGANQRGRRSLIGERIPQIGGVGVVDAGGDHGLGGLAVALEIADGARHGAHMRGEIEWHGATPSSVTKAYNVTI